MDETIKRPQHKGCIHASSFSPADESGFGALNLSAGQAYESTVRNRHNNIGLLLKGEIDFSYNEYVGRRFSAGDLFFVPKASEAHCVALSDADILVLSFSSYTDLLDCNSNILGNDAIENVHYDFRPIPITPVVRQFAELMKVYLQESISCYTMQKMKKQELFALLRFQYSSDQLAELFYPILGRNPEFRAKVMEISHENLTVEQMAERFNMSARNFSRKFKMEFGDSVRQWMLNEKAKQIKLRLMVPGTTISDIVSQFGFTSPTYFNEYCWKYYNCTPGDLIKQLRNK